MYSCCPLTSTVSSEQILETIAEIALQIQQSHPLQDILLYAAEQAQELLQASQVSIYRFLPQNELEVIATASLPNFSFNLNSLLSDRSIQDIWWANIQQSEITTIANVNTSNLPTQLQNLFSNHNIQAIVGITLFRNTQAWGMLLIYKEQSHVWQAAELQLVKQLACHCGLAIAQTQVTQHLEQQTLENIDLQRSEELFRQLAEHINEVFFIESVIPAHIIYVSPAYERVWGRPRSELDQNPSSWIEAIHPEDRDRVESSFTLMLAGEPTQKEFRIIRPDGSIRWIFARTFPIYDISGRLLRQVGIAEDVTERRQVEETLWNLNQELESRVRERTIELQKSEMRFALALRNTPVVVFTQDLDLRYTWIYNPKLGLKVKDIIGKTDADLMAPDSATLLTQIKLQVLRTGIGKSQEIAITSIQGKTEYYNLTIEPLKNERAEIIGIACAALDITNLKEAAIEVRESQKFVQRIADTSPSLLYIYDLEAAEDIYINRKITTLFDYSDDSQDEESIQTHPDDLERLAKYRENLQYIPDGAVWEIEYRLKKTNTDAWKWVSTRNSIFARDAKGQVKQIIGIVQDISDRKQAEETLRVSEEKFRNFFDFSPIGIAVADVETCRFLVVNTAFCQLLGYDELEMLTLSCPSISHADDLEAEAPYLEALLAGEIESYQIEKRYLKKNGEILIGHLTATMIWDGEGKAKHIIGMVQDITARKQAEKQLRQNEAFLREAQEVAHMGSWEFDLATQKVRWSTETFNIFKLDPAQGEPTYEQLYQYLHPDDRKYHQEVVERAIQQGEPYAIDIRIVRADASSGYMFIKGQTICNPEGKVERLFGIVMDISDRKQVEKALEEKNVILQSVIDGSPDIIFVKTTDGKMVSINSAYAKFYNKSVQEITNKNESELLAPSSLYYVRELDNQVISTGLSETIEETLPDDNLKRTFLTTKYPWRDSQGNIVGLIGIARDISTLKATEVRLRQQAEREQLLRVISQRIRQSLDLDEILATTVNEVRKTLQADRALIFRVFPSGDQRILKESVLPTYPSLVDQHWHDECKSLTNTNQYISGQPKIMSRGMAQDTASSCLETLMAAIGIYSKVSAPIIQVTSEGSIQIWGLLIVHSCVEERQWQPADADFLQQISNQLAIAIQQADLYHRVQIELSERKEVESQLRTSLQEKEVLLKEVHHRVKNNLQTVSSLLNLQANYIEDPQVMMLFAESQRRIKVMALIHEKLYRSNNLAKINFGEYLQELVKDLFKSYINKNLIVSYNVKVDSIELAVDQAIPCGLIVNELVSNAIKHAFPNRRIGEINICFELVSGQNSPNSHCFLLSVADNGVGLSDKVDFKKVESLGLQLVYELSNKLKGKIELNCSEGTLFKILFPSTCN